MKTLITIIAAFLCNCVPAVNDSTIYFTVQTHNLVGGKIIVDPPGNKYPKGSTVKLTAVPDSGYMFQYWNIDVFGVENPIEIVMNTHKNISANFLKGSPLHGIEWSAIAGKSYSAKESLSVCQTVKITMRFGYGDTIYMTKYYYNPNPNKYSNCSNISYYRYFRCPVFNKHWEIPPPIEEYNDTNLVFTYKCKEYADSRYETPVIDNSPLVEWFVWKEVNNQLYMGYIDEITRKAYYWIWNKEL
jgi:hypothetical protein